MPAGSRTTAGSWAWTSFLAGVSPHPERTEPGSRAAARPADTRSAASPHAPRSRPTPETLRRVCLCFWRKAEEARLCTSSTALKCWSAWTWLYGSYDSWSGHVTSMWLLHPEVLNNWSETAMMENWCIQFLLCGLSKTRWSYLFKHIYIISWGVYSQTIKLKTKINKKSPHILLKFYIFISHFDLFVTCKVVHAHYLAMVLCIFISNEWNK